MELKLNKAKVNHLLGLLEVNEREEWYYGNKEHYLKRHNELKTELKLLIASVVVPKGTLSDFEKWLDKKGNESYCRLPSRYVLGKYKSLNAL
jgi:hypothetical protein